MKRGLFISIEGPDGSGKSTQVENIKEFFRDKGLEILFTREPGGTPIGERIREIILDKNCSEMCAVTEAMLYAAARAQHVEQVIKPALGMGKIVVCDRFVDSSLAYQGFGRGLGEPVKIINDYAIDGCMPDVTFLMKIDPKIGRRRIADSQKDRLEKEQDEFHAAVFRGYLELEKRFPDRIVAIDAMGSVEEIKADIYAKLKEVLESVS